MAPPTQWTWVWANSGRCWRTGEPGMLQSMVSQRVGQWLNNKSKIIVIYAAEGDSRKQTAAKPRQEQPHRVPAGTSQQELATPQLMTLSKRSWVLLSRRNFPDDILCLSAHRTDRPVNPREEVLRQGIGPHSENPIKNHLVRVWTPGSFMDQRWGKVRKQRKPVD